MTTRPDANMGLVKRILGDAYLELRLVHLTIDEAFADSGGEQPRDEDEAGMCRVKAETVDTHGVRQNVEGKGCGMVDALFRGLLGRYAIEYQSLESIQLDDFEVKAQLDTKSGRSGVDARGTVTVVVKNSEHKRFAFSDASRSVTASTARAVLAAAEYFVNAERAFITLYKSLKDAQQRNRSDLIARYTSEMAEIVKSTSYGSVIEKIKSELG